MQPHITQTLADIDRRILELNQAATWLRANLGGPGPGPEPVAASHAAIATTPASPGPVAASPRNGKPRGLSARAEVWAQIARLPGPFGTGDLRSALTERQLLDLFSHAVRTNKLLRVGRGRFQQGPDFPATLPTGTARVASAKTPAPAGPKPPKLIDLMRQAIVDFKGNFSRQELSDRLRQSHPQQDLHSVATNLTDMTSRGELTRVGFGTGAIYTPARVLTPARNRPLAHQPTAQERNYEEIRRSIHVPRDPEGEQG